LFFSSYLGPDPTGAVVVKTKVLNVCKVKAGDAETLTETILTILTSQKKLPMPAFSSFASDGASVMIGAFLLLLFFNFIPVLT